jgi:hypothetical protein
MGPAAHDDGRRDQRRREDAGQRGETGILKRDKVVPRLSDVRDQLQALVGGKKSIASWPALRPPRSLRRPRRRRRAPRRSSVGGVRAVHGAAAEKTT